MSNQFYFLVMLDKKKIHVQILSYTNLILVLYLKGPGTDAHINTMLKLSSKCDELVTVCISSQANDLVVGGAG